MPLIFFKTPWKHKKMSGFVMVSGGKGGTSGMKWVKWVNEITNHFPGICDALRDFVRFTQFKKREKHPWSSITLKPATLLNVTLFQGCFSCFSYCSNGAKSCKASPDRYCLIFFLASLEWLKWWDEVWNVFEYERFIIIKGLGTKLLRWFWNKTVLRQNSCFPLFCVPYVNPFHSTGVFLYLLKKENLCFSNVFGA